MKNGKIIGLVFLLGILAGLGGAFIVQQMEKSQAEEITAVDTTPDEAGQSGALLARIREQEKEIVHLQAQLNSTRQELQTAVVSEDIEPEPEPERRSGFARQMEARMGRRVDSLVADYGLNDSQRAQLEEVFRMQFENFRARRSGEAVERFNLDDAIAGVLTEEQFAEYLEDSQEEIYNRAELIATTQLVRLSQSVELADDQQELVYDAVHSTAQEWMIARQTGEDFDMRQVVQERLGTILTEEQLSAYLQGMERGPGFGGPGGGP
jgi:hypothetical protein